MIIIYNETFMFLFFFLENVYRALLQYRLSHWVLERMCYKSPLKEQVRWIKLEAQNRVKHLV